MMIQIASSKIDQAIELPSDIRNDALYLLIHGFENLPSTIRKHHKKSYGLCTDHSDDSSSCTSKTSFSWSDFPLINEHYNDNDINILCSWPLISKDCCEKRMQPTDYAPTETQHMENSAIYNITAASLSQRSSSTCIKTKDKDDGKKKKKYVTFSEILEVQSYERIVGDHPCCSSALPLSLGWKHSENQFVNIDVQQNKRNDEGGHCCKFRQKLRLNYSERLCLLQNSTGLSELELIRIEIEQGYAFSKQQQQKQNQQYEEYSKVRPLLLLSLQQAQGSSCLSRGWPSIASRLCENVMV